MKTYKRVIVLGFDGLEPKLLERFMAEGRLPSFQKLAESGGFSRVATTFPAQTPVAWSTFAVGANPGAHGIFDFIARDAATHLPDLSFTRYEQKNPFVPAKVVNRRRGRPFWEDLSAVGVSSAIIRCPCTYPSERISGNLLYGMGVPDLRGSLGTSTFYSSAEDAEMQESEHLVQLSSKDGRRFRTHIVGPPDQRKDRDFEFEIDLEVDAATETAVIRSRGAPGELRLERGRWSDWLKVKFKLPMLQSVRGMVRFLLLKTAPVVELFASPVNFDPQAPPFPIGSPDEYPKELEQAIGTYATTGMVEENDGLDHGRIDEAEFLDQCELVWKEREAMLEHELGRLDEGFVYCLFDTSDRIQHMFWRFGEPDHPANRAGEDLARYEPVIAETYERCDRILARTLDRFADDETLVISLSDHGFTRFRRALHLNAFLRQAGYLVYEDDAAEGADFFAGVDWSRSRAYAVGFGSIFLNRAGREKDGIVTEAEAADLMTEIRAALLEIRDPETGEAALSRVMLADEIYEGACIADAPDLLVCCRDGYRVSSRTALGGAPPELFEDNRDKWSGDHIVDPELVPGILLMNRPFDVEGPRLEDLAPTILAAFGYRQTKAMEGRNLFS